jgi:hypothetical protein
MGNDESLNDFVRDWGFADEASNEEFRAALKGLIDSYARQGAAVSGGGPTAELGRSRPIRMIDV